MSIHRGTVRTWHPEEGWGSIEITDPAARSECWFLFDTLRGITPDDVQVGMSCYLTLEEAEQDGYAFSALTVARTEADLSGESSLDTDGQSFASSLQLRFDSGPAGDHPTEGIDEDH